MLRFFFWKSPLTRKKKKKLILILSSLKRRPPPNQQTHPRRRLHLVHQQDVNNNNNNKDRTKILTIIYLILTVSRLLSDRYSSYMMLWFYFLFIQKFNESSIDEWHPHVRSRCVKYQSIDDVNGNSLIYNWTSMKKAYIIEWSINYSDFFFLSKEPLHNHIVTQLPVYSLFLIKIRGRINNLV